MNEPLGPRPLAQTGRRVAAAALAVALLVVGTSARQRRTTDPGDTEYARNERRAEQSAAYYRSGPTFWPLIVWAKRDVSKLQKRASSLAASALRPTPDLRAARKQAGKVSKHSHTAFRWLQGHRQSRTHVEPRVGPPRDLGTTLGDIGDIECLAGEVAGDVFSFESRHRLDVGRHTAILEKLERIEALARQVEADLRDR